MFTVRVENMVLGSAKFEGTFETKEEAIESAKRKADRSRDFAVFVVYTGTPRNPGEPTGDAWRGSQKAVRND